MALELNGTTGVSLVQDGVVTAADLNSTLDLSGKTVTLPAGVGGKVLQCAVVWNSSTAYTNGTFRNLAGTDFYYYENTVIGGSMTKQSATSTLVVVSQYAYRSVSNSHDTICWRGSKDGSSNLSSYHIGYDPYRHNNFGENANHHSFTCVFTGIGTGAHSFWLVSGRGDSSAFSTVHLNYNTQAVTSSDTINQNTQSSMVVWEIEQ